MHLESVREYMKSVQLIEKIKEQKTSKNTHQKSILNRLQDDIEIKYQRQNRDMLENKMMKDLQIKESQMYSKSQT